MVWIFTNRVSIACCILFLLSLGGFPVKTGMCQIIHGSKGDRTLQEPGNRYYDAVDYLVKNAWMVDSLEGNHISPDIAYGIIFPGLVKYTIIRDIVESSAYRMLYVQQGRKYAHFAVGRFQMKPSFAELIERNVTRKKMTIHEFDLRNTAHARAQRVTRLNSPEWQLRYLVFFIRLMDKRFNRVEWKSDKDKMRFYATAFDVGYNRDERTIRKMMNPSPRYIKLRKSKKTERYGDVAMQFFMNDGHRFRLTNSAE